MAAGIEIAAQGRFAGAQDTGFLESHAFAGIAQPVRMVQADAGDQRQVGVDQVDRIQAPAKADFQHREVQPGALEQPEGGQRAHFEIGQGNLATCGLHRREGVAQLRIAGLDAIDPHPLVVAQQVRRAVDPDRHPCSRSSSASRAQVEPLPLVPVTVTTRFAGLPRPSRRATSRERSRPMSMAVGWSCSR